MTDSPKAHARPSRAAFLILLSVLLLGVALMGLAVMASLSGALTPAVPTPQIEGITALVPTEPIPDFTLTDQNGQPVSLSSFRGRYVMLFFGFTNCPDFCPLTLADFKQVKESLGEQADEVEFVFVSVDGERDTPEVLGRYVERFDPTFVGLQGEEAEIREIGRPFGLSFQLNQESPEDTTYTVDHSTLTYILDREGALHSLVSFGTPVPVVADYLRTLIG